MSELREAIGVMVLKMKEALPELETITLEEAKSSIRILISGLETAIELDEVLEQVKVEKEAPTLPMNEPVSVLWAYAPDLNGEEEWTLGTEDREKTIEIARERFGDQGFYIGQAIPIDPAFCLVHAFSAGFLLEDAQEFAAGELGCLDGDEEILTVKGVTEDERTMKVRTLESNLKSVVEQWARENLESTRRHVPSSEYIPGTGEVETLALTPG